MPCYAIDGVVPVVHPGAFVHPSAVLIGDVQVGDRCYVGPAACLRGDFGAVVLCDGANVQDTCVLHGFPERETRVEEDGHIGHGAVLHGCRVERDALVGMNAVVMDDAVIGAQAIVGACAFVAARTHIPPRSLATGLPARVVRLLSEAELAWKRDGTASYHDLVRRSLSTMLEVDPLPAPPAQRPRLQAVGTSPLVDLSRGPNPAADR